MPLSDHEQQILADIEARLRADDPNLVSTVAETTVTTHAQRQLRLAAVWFAVGFVLLLVGVVNLVVGIVGFALMLAATAHGARQVQRLRAHVVRRDGRPPARYADRTRRRDES